jgi:hypothetical protein
MLFSPGGASVAFSAYTLAHIFQPHVRWILAVYRNLWLWVFSFSSLSSSFHDCKLKSLFAFTWLRDCGPQRFFQEPKEGVEILPIIYRLMGDSPISSTNISTTDQCSNAGKENYCAINIIV